MAGRRAFHLARPHMPARGQRCSFLAEGTAWMEAQRLETVCAGEESGIQEAVTERRSQQPKAECEGELREGLGTLPQTNREIVGAAEQGPGDDNIAEVRRRVLRLGT